MKRKPCKKSRFSTMEKANKKLEEIKAAPTDGPKPIRSYICGDCGSWHLSSHTLAKQLQIEKRLKRAKEDR